jgi:hypothetical protein
MKYAILRGFLDEAIVEQLVDCYIAPPKEKHKLNLLDGDDVTNTKYESSRSHGLNYMYARSKKVETYSRHVKRRLKLYTGILFNSGINKLCLPFCQYDNGGVILAHRGVKKEANLTEYQGYVAVCMLTQRQKDFDNGFFYLNEKAECSPDGKTVTGDKQGDRFYPQLYKGDVIVFDNTHFIHGVEPTIVTYPHIQMGKGMRLTCSFRTD